MCKKLNEIKKENFENMKVGFLLELGFRQNSINNEINQLIEFLEDNTEFFNITDINSLTAGLNNFTELLLNFTDLVFKDVDTNGKYYTYHKDFY